MLPRALFVAIFVLTVLLGFNRTAAAQPPTITGLDPASGSTAGGTGVSIFGTDLDTVTSVTFGGVAANILGQLPHAMFVQTPAHAAGPVDVVVTNPDGNDTEVNGFTYFTPDGPAPTVDDVRLTSNNNPARGSTLGGAEITITGTNFRKPGDGSGAAAAATVRIGSLDATNVVVVDSTTITAVAPQSQGGFLGPTIVIVTNSDSTSGMLGNGFTYASLCEADIPVNCISVLQVNGGPAPGSIAVEMFSPQPSSIQFSVTNTANADRFELAPDVPNTAVMTLVFKGTAPFHPVLALGTAIFQNQGFQWNDAADEATVTFQPAVTSWATAGCTPSPGSCPLQADRDYSALALVVLDDLTGIGADPALVALAQGAFISTNGQYFSLPDFDEEAGALTFDVGAPSLPDADSDGIDDPSTFADNNQGSFRFLVPDAIITGYWNSTPADMLLLSNSLVTIGGQPVMPTVTDVAATATSPDGVLFEFAGFHYSFEDIAIIVAPTVTSIIPTSGLTTGGTSVTITGKNFRAGATVTIGGVAATNVVVVSKTTITATTGAHASGATDVVVTNSDTTTDALANGFTYAVPAVAPSITTHPANQSIVAGQNAQFTAAASGDPVPTFQWQISTDGGSTWTALTDAAPYSGVTTGTLTVTAAPATLADARYRAVATNSAGSANSNAATLSVFAAGTFNPTSLSFTATKNGASGDLESVTAPQTVELTFPASGATWTAAADQPWVQLSSTSGTGNGTFTVSIVNPGNVLGGSTDVSANITVSASSFGLTSTLPVGLTIYLHPENSLPPFGFVDTPVEGATEVSGSLGVTGWALDDVGVESVKIYRNCLSIDNPASCQSVGGAQVVFIGNAAFLAGARPDVEALHLDHPQAYRAGWGFLLLTNMLPHIPSGNPERGGQGTITLYAHAIDEEGNGTLLGTRTITLDNDNLARPFGVLDTPEPGTTVSGTFANFGWALTPGPAMIPTDGSTMRVVVDGVMIGNVTYNQCRLGPTNLPPVGTCQDDVATLVPSHTNITNGRGAIGSFDIDTTLLSDGLHTIAWGVVDDQGRSEGIGSRFFTVSNGSSLVPAGGASLSDVSANMLGDAVDVQALSMSVASIHGRVGFNLDAPLMRIDADRAGVRHVTLSELGRIELVFSDTIDGAYLVANGTLRPLPPGSTLDVAARRFTWAPGAGYIGTYELVFVQDGMQLPVSVHIRAKQVELAGQMRGHIDLPAPSTTVSGSFVVAGWALDLAAWQGSGVGAVHVWAQRRDVTAASPIFLGAADIDGARPDVATQFGAQFDRTGWGLTTIGLERGEYDITAYFWSTRTQQFEDARTVLVEIR